VKMSKRIFVDGPLCSFKDLCRALVCLSYVLNA
jgi:hypothetical protein